MLHNCIYRIISCILLRSCIFCVINIYFAEQRRREKEESAEREIKKSRLVSYKDDEDDKYIEASPRCSDKGKMKHDRDKDR